VTLLLLGIVTLALAIGGAIANRIKRKFET
jgi:hypothetical protein